MGTNKPTGRDIVPGFAAALTAAREAAGMSREALAAAAGVSFNTVYAIESERRAPSLRVAVALSEALGVTASELAGQRSRNRRPQKNGKPK